MAILIRTTAPARRTCCSSLYCLGFSFPRRCCRSLALLYASGIIQDEQEGADNHLFAYPSDSQMVALLDQDGGDLDTTIVIVIVLTVFHVCGYLHSGRIAIGTPHRYAGSRQLAFYRWQRLPIAASSA